MLGNKALQKAYHDRNLAVQAMARMASSLGFKVGLIVDHIEPDWQALVIDLPTGLVAWFMPKNEILGQWPKYDGEWGGHTLDEKVERVEKFVQGMAGEDG